MARKPSVVLCCCRNFRPTQVTFYCLTAMLLFLVLLLILHYVLEVGGETSVSALMASIQAASLLTQNSPSQELDDRWFVDDVTRENRGRMCAVACASHSTALFFATAYSTGKKRPPVFAAALYHAFAAVTFELDAMGLLYRPWGLDFSLYGLAVGSGVIIYGTVGSLFSLHYNEERADAILSERVFFVPPMWYCLWPVARFFLMTWTDYTLSLPIAASIATVTLSVYFWLGWHAHERTKALLPLHWTVSATGFAVSLAWVTSEMVHLAIAAGAPLGGATAIGTVQVTILLKTLHITVGVSQSILNFEESNRFKAERDAAHAELASTLLAQQQAQQAEEARQKFLRYVFHEIRVPFNSIDMGLGILLEDIAEAEQEKGAWHGGPTTTSQGVLLPQDAKATLDIMAKAATSMKVIINDTLDWTKLQSGAFQISMAGTRIGEVVTSTLVGLTNFAMHPDNKVKLVQEIDPNLPTWLLADKVRLQQVVANFLSNAIKFAPHDGTGIVTVKVHAVQDSTRRTSQPESSSLMSPFDPSKIWWKEPAASSERRRTSAGSIASSILSQHSVSVSSPAAARGQSQDYSVEGDTQHPGTPSWDASVKRRSRADAHSSMPVLGMPEFRPDARIRLALDGFHVMHVSEKPGTDGNAYTSKVEDTEATCTVVISVKDNGEGIKSRELPSLFKAFRQLDAGMQYKGKGTGLGLAICHEIVTLHGGRVGVRSSGKRGEGAEFLIALRLPMLYRDAVASSSMGSSAQDGGNGYMPHRLPTQEVADTDMQHSINAQAGNTRWHGSTRDRPGSSLSANGDFCLVHVPPPPEPQAMFAQRFSLASSHSSSSQASANEMRVRDVHEQMLLRAAAAAKMAPGSFVGPLMSPPGAVARGSSAHAGGRGRTTNGSFMKSSANSKSVGTFDQRGDSDSTAGRTDVRSPCAVCGSPSPLMGSCRKCGGGVTAVSSPLAPVRPPAPRPPSHLQSSEGLESESPHGSAGIATASRRPAAQVHANSKGANAQPAGAAGAGHSSSAAATRVDLAESGSNVLLPGSVGSCAASSDDVASEYRQGTGNGHHSAAHGSDVDINGAQHTSTRIAADHRPLFDCEKVVSTTVTNVEFDHIALHATAGDVNQPDRDAFQHGVLTGARASATAGKEATADMDASESSSDRARDPLVVSTGAWQGDQPDQLSMRVHAPKAANAADSVITMSSASSNFLDMTPGRASAPILGKESRIEGNVLRVLIVDDVADNRRLLHKSLKRRLQTLLPKHLPGQPWHIEVDEAEDGHIAVEMVTGRTVENLSSQECPSCSLGPDHPEVAHTTRYDLVTMDAEMPVLSGFRATELIRSSGYEGMLYGCTGNALEADQQLFLQKGADEIFIKPLDIGAIAQAVLQRLSTEWSRTGKQG